MSRGQFFAIDRRTWKMVCDQKNMNEAVAYLVLAQGTGGDNRGTSWSVGSLREYAGISFERGKAAIQNLFALGLIRHAETSTRTKPRYELLTHTEIRDGLGLDRPKLEVQWQRQLYESIRAGTQPNRRSKTDLRTADYFVGMGWLKKSLNGDYCVPNVSPEPELIYLPNQLVTGTERGEDSPVKRLRAGGDPWSLRLLVDLYDVHNLRDDGGISPKILFQAFDRKVAGTKGVYNIWGFREKHLSLRWMGPLDAQHRRLQEPNTGHPVWESIGILKRQGLLSFVPHLWDSDPTETDAEIIHAYGIPGAGEPVEIELGEAAHAAAVEMVPEHQFTRMRLEGFDLFAPVVKSIPNVALVGVARLRYRPKTKRTGDWFKELNDTAGQWTSRYQTEIRAGNTRMAYAQTLAG